MLAKVEAAAATAPPIANMPTEMGADKQAVAAQICAQMATNGGYVEPCDTYKPFTPSPAPPPGPPAPPTPPTPPSPIPHKCKAALQAACPGPFETPSDCLLCTRKCHQSGGGGKQSCGGCDPKERHAYCPGS
jgi:hypothetical protein